MNRKLITIGMLTFLFTFSVITGVSAESVQPDSVLTASTNIKLFVEKNGQLPNFVVMGNKKYSMEQYLYASSNYIFSAQIGALNKAYLYDDEKQKVKKSSKPTPRTIKANIDMQTYSNMALRTANFISRNEKAPSVISSKYGDLQFQTAVYGFAKVLDYYKKNKVMPKYVSLNVAKTSKLAKNMPNF